MDHLLLVDVAERAGASPVALAGARRCDRGGSQHRPASVESALTDLGGRRRWLAPLVYAAGTVAVVFDGVLLLLRNWRLTLLQLFPAVWISVMTWNMKSHLVSKPTFSTSVVIAAAIGVLLAAQVAYWSNATFAYTMAKDATDDIRAAFARGSTSLASDRRPRAAHRWAAGGDLAAAAARSRRLALGRAAS